MAEFMESPRFERRPSFSFVSAPAYRVDRPAVLSGRMERNLLWQAALRRLTVNVGPRVEEDVEYVLNFWHAVDGGYCGFRITDHVDYKSCGVFQTPAATDQPLTQIGTSGTYQLEKHYTAGARTKVRPIKKPVAATIVVANDLGEVQAPDRWSLDSTTGILTPEVSFDGTPTTWGGEFDIPVWFETDDLPIEVIGKRIEHVTFTLLEGRL